MAGAAAAAAALAAANVTVVVDPVAAPPEPFAHYWERCVGSGHASLGARADWQRHLALARRELGFDSVRMHGVLDDDMSVYMKNQNGGKAGPPDGYSFYNVDLVYDFLQSIGMRPLVELGFMPCALAGCARPHDGCHMAFTGLDSSGYKACTAPPTDYAEWGDLVAAFVTHVVRRYGAAEVRRWEFEVWNEMWGVPFPDPYMRLYNASAAAVKGVDAALRVGGPATMCLQHAADFVRAAAAAGAPVDFVSTHAYPLDGACIANYSAADPDFFAHAIARTRREVAAAAGGAAPPFYLTEYNDGHGGAHDAALLSGRSYAAAFAVRNVALLDGVTDLLSWWTFTDIFEEGGMGALPFDYPQWGLLSKDGVRKPAYRAFELLHGAGRWRVPARGAGAVSALATAGDAAGGGLQVLLANYEPVHTGVAPAAATVELRIAARGARGARLRRIDAEHANPVEAWEAMGRPSYMNTSQVAALHAASELRAEEVPLRPGPGGTVSLTVALPPQSVAHIEVQYA